MTNSHIDRRDRTPRDMGLRRATGTLLCGLLLCQSCWTQTIPSRAGTSAPTTTKSFIELLDPPRIVSDRTRVELLYHCQRDQVVHVDVLASSVTRPLVGIYKRRWACNPGDKAKLRELRLDFPDQVVYNEDWLLRKPIYVTEVLLRTWISDFPLDFDVPDGITYDRGVVKVTHPMESLPPYSRPYKKHQRSPRWDRDLLWRVRRNKVPRCPAEQEVISLLPFLYACTGEGFGVTRSVKTYMDQALELQRQRLVVAPRCSFSAWVYLSAPCPAAYCGLLYRVDLHHDYATPTLLVAASGHVHVQVVLANREERAFLSSAPVPLQRWCRILLTLELSLANLTVLCGSDFNTKSFRFPDDILLEDTVGTFHLGGSRFVPGMSGFYGPSVYHRNKIVSVYKAAPPEIIERVELAQWFVKCQEFKNESTENFQHFLSAATSEQKTDGCRDVYTDLVARHHLPRAGPQCAQWEEPPRPHRVVITRLLRKRARRGGHPEFNSELFGRALHGLYLKRVLAPGGLSRAGGSMPLLLQAGCLGHLPALYMAAVLFHTGLGVRRDQYKALKFSLISAQKEDRLSQLSLGHKHHLGVDGFPLDYDLSYGYYANIALQTTTDRLHPDRNQAFVEIVRLNDEKVLKQQTKENDDLFMWLRFQARQGVSSAQQTVSRMLFWGQQGISSNPEAAVKFYQRGAMQQKDPVLMYDYGVVLLRGQGVKADIPKAVEYLQKAADMDFAPAINSLGWYYEQHEGNYEKAVEFWEKADKLGNAEAPYNLGILHDHGLYPGKPRNQSAAYRYYLKSTMRGHIDAAVKVSACWIQGIPDVVDRLPYDAMVWTKWAGEQNGYLGALLRKALDSYQEQSWPAALLYFLQAAETGFEVGQFNAAYMCETDPEGVASRHLQIDCQWKYYNLSTHSEWPTAYSQLKMGDLFYSHHSRRKRDVPAAVQMYAAAALQQEPQGLYNLGILVEEGVSLPRSTLRKLGFNSSHTANNYTIIMELYRRCRDHEQEDSYVPCSLALLNAHLQYAWAFHGSILKYSSAATITIVAVLSLMTIFARLQNAGRQLQLSV